MFASYSRFHPFAINLFLGRSLSKPSIAIFIIPLLSVAVLDRVESASCFRLPTIIQARLNFDLRIILPLFFLVECQLDVTQWIHHFKIQS